MPINKKTIQTIINLKSEFENLYPGKESLIKIIDDSEISENVFNSNAIENSTLSLKETERILMELEISRNISIREAFEAKNLARVMEYTNNKATEKELSKELILLLHKMLIDNIDNSIAGRFRTIGEYVRIGTYIAPPPEQVEQIIDNILQSYFSNFQDFFLEKISRFHLDFEKVHPFCDGNGRIGRVIINYQLNRIGFPNIIIRDSEKQKYYKSFKNNTTPNKANDMLKIISFALIESFHKRNAYLRGDKIITISEFAQNHPKSKTTLLNAAKRQTIPAFRERNIWKIGIKY